MQRCQFRAGLAEHDGAGIGEDRTRMLWSEARDQRLPVRDEEQDEEDRDEETPGEALLRLFL